MHSHGHKTTVFVKMNSYIILYYFERGAHWKGVINRIATVITVLEAILTGKQSRENIQCFVYFSFLPTKISQEKLWRNVWKI